MFAKNKTRLLRIGTKVLGILLWVGIGTLPLACLTINKDAPPDSRPNSGVNVGGDKGVDVQRSDSQTDVKIGGDKGIVVEHPRD